MSLIKYVLFVICFMFLIGHSDYAGANEEKTKTLYDGFEAEFFCATIESTTDYCTIKSIYIRSLGYPIYRAFFKISEHQDNLPTQKEQYAPYKTSAEADTYCSTVMQDPGAVSCSSTPVQALDDHFYEAKYVIISNWTCPNCRVVPPTKYLPEDSPVPPIN